MRPVRVAFISADGFTGRGGIARVGAYLSEGLRAAAPDIDLRAYPSRLTETSILKHLTVPVALARFLFAAASGRIDLAHINVARRGSTWRKMCYAHLARMAGIPIVLHLHGSGYDGYFAALSAGAKARVRRFFGSADRVVALSRHWRDFLLREMQLPADRVTIIANGVALPQSSVLRQAAGGPVRILFLGLVGERKGVDLLLRALALLSADLPDWQATIAGNGEVERARGLAAELGLEARVTFPGWVDASEAGRLLAASDLFVLPSRAENQPVAIMEAMAHGLPVIGSDAGAIPEQIQHDETGIVVPAGTVEPLAHAVAALIGDAGRRQAMGEAGRARAAERFSIAASAGQFAALYRNLVRRT